MDQNRGAKRITGRRFGAKVSVALEPDLIERLEELSRERGISISGLVRMAVHRWLASVSGSASGSELGSESPKSESASESKGV
jgi:predicted DNA-binding ribbon-helix-helix protein